MANKQYNNGKKIHIHPITYVLCFFFLALIITAIVLLTPTKIKKLQVEYNKHLISTLVNQNDKEAQAFSNYYDKMRLEDDDMKLFNITTVSKIDSKIQEKKGIIILCQGGYFSKEFIIKLGLFKSRLVEHDLYKNKKVDKINILLQEVSYDDNVSAINELYKKYEVDEYDYLKEKNPTYPIFTAYVDGKAVKFEKEEIKPESFNYREINLCFDKFLDKIYQTITK